jgi:cytochrome c-type biogenesis protein CcmH/NrfG
MRAESFVFAVAGIVFGLFVGWIIGDQQARKSAPAALTVAPAAAPSNQAAAQQQPPALDDTKVQALTNVATNDAKNVNARVELGNLYFDSERFTDAIKWYEDALKLDPKNVNLSTDLGISYYYSNQPDRALTQFAHSLSLDPNHVKTLLNQGIVRAFGKRDLEGAMQSWQKVIEVAPPGSPEAATAQRALESLKAAHAGGGAATPGS